MAKTTTDVPAMPAYKEPAPKSRASFQIHAKHKKMMPSVKVGDKHTFKVTGKVTGMRSDEYGHSVDLDMDSLGNDVDNDQEQESNDVATPMNNTIVKSSDAVPGSLTGALRKRHGGTGRFIG